MLCDFLTLIFGCTTHATYLCSCALTLDAGKCRLGDLKFTFIGYVGVITKLDNEQVRVFVLHPFLSLLG